MKPGGLLAACTLLAIIPFEYSGASWASLMAGVCVCAMVLVFFAHIPWSRRAFVLIGLTLMALAIATLPDWQNTLGEGLQRAAFIAAFFTATASIRSAASGSSSITACGNFLAHQPPGRRYLALTLGGHLFGLILSYGAIALLSTLATNSTSTETNPEIREHRTRRMLVAIQRGFISALPWTPLGFAMAISTILVPGARWIDALLPCLVSAFIMVVSGWALDTLFKPRLSTPPPPRDNIDNNWLQQLRPLLILLFLLIVLSTALHALTGVRTVGIMMSVVPLIALVWTAIQGTQLSLTERIVHSAQRATTFATVELPAMRSELVLLTMAGFIGAVGADLFTPLVSASGIDLSEAPAIVVLLSVFWLIPIAGQLGMNPILAVSLFAPLLPTPTELGISPTAMIVTITGGWAVAGATSPFTASTLLMANFGKVSGRYAGLRWNGPYALTSGLLLSGWIFVVSQWL